MGQMPLFLTSCDPREQASIRAALLFYRLWQNQRKRNCWRPLTLSGPSVMTDGSIIQGGSVWGVRAADWEPRGDLIQSSASERCNSPNAHPHCVLFTALSNKNCTWNFNWNVVKTGKSRPSSLRNSLLFIWQRVNIFWEKVLFSFRTWH